MWPEHRIDGAWGKKIATSCVPTLVSWRHYETCYLKNLPISCKKNSCSCYLGLRYCAMRTPSLFVCLFVYVTVFQPRLWPFRLRIFCIPRSHNGNWHTHKNAYPEMNEKMKYLSNSFNKQIIRNSRERYLYLNETSFRWNITRIGIWGLEFKFSRSGTSCCTIWTHGEPCLISGDYLYLHSVSLQEWKLMFAPLLCLY